MIVLEKKEATEFYKKFKKFSLWEWNLATLHVVNLLDPQKVRAMVQLIMAVLVLLDCRIVTYML